MFNELKLVENVAKDVQITFTDYFYRKLGLNFLMAGASANIMNVYTNLSSEYVNNELQYSSGLYRNSGDKNLNTDIYLGNYNRTLKGSVGNVPGLSNIFYKVVYGMYTLNLEANTHNQYYQINIDTEDKYFYSDELDPDKNRYNSWYKEGVFFYPPTWHVNPTINVESSVESEDSLIGTSDYKVLYAVPFGNVILDPGTDNCKIRYEVRSDISGNNVINIHLENTLSVADLIDISDYFIYEGQFCLTSMAVVDIFGQPLILATFPLKSLSVGINLTDEYIISLGIPYLQPTP